MRRRAALAALAATSAQAADDDDAVQPGRALRFPRDHGAHPGTRIEWWYATGVLMRDGGGLVGFQLTFFRSRTGLAAELPGRFAPRQLLFAHAAISEVAAKRHRHAQRIARWSGEAASASAQASIDDTAIQLGAWGLTRGDPGYRARLAAPEAGFTLALLLQPTQPLLLQGDAGYSRKGPLPGQASCYYSQPQLAARAELVLDGRTEVLRGTAWLDHEWSNQLMPADAVGWDWIGINLDGGGALTAFQLRRQDGSALWAGGSHRAAGGVARSFGAGEVRFVGGRTWPSPITGARYPVQWTITTPLGEHLVEALFDAQELDSRGSTGAVYWEGIAELRDARGQRIGLGYLEMTGRFAPLRLV